MVDAVMADSIEDDALEAMLGEAREAYLEWFRVQLEPVKAAAQKLGASDHEAAWKTVFNFFHDLKGGGGSVGLDLLSAVGASACGYLRKIDSSDDRAANVTLAHVAISEKIVAAGIRGDGGQAGAALIARLQELSQA